jgi:hypothetical protein
MKTARRVSQITKFGESPPKSAIFDWDLQFRGAGVFRSSVFSEAAHGQVRAVAATSSGGSGSLITIAAS